MLGLFRCCGLLRLKKLTKIQSSSDIVAFLALVLKKRDPPPWIRANVVKSPQFVIGTRRSGMLVT